MPSKFVISSSVKFKKGKKIFKPTKKPRYLYGQVAANTIKADLDMYNQHRYNIWSAVPKVDTSPPFMNPFNYIDAKKMAEDAQRLKWIDRENKELLKKINIINRHGGKVDTFNPVAYDRGASKWSEHEYKMQRIVKDNKVIFSRLIQATSDYRKEEMDKFWCAVVNKMKFTAKFPLVIFQKKDYDKELKRFPSISEVKEEGSPLVTRPKCFLDFKYADGIKLGRVIVQLYYDQAPVTVENFLSLCKGDNFYTYKKSIVHNIVRGKCVELGDITKGNGKGGISIYGKTFAEEKTPLKHTRPGVLSMIRVGDKENNSQFCITFDKVESFDGKRTVFGKVVKGFETMLKIQDLGKKVGKPSLPVEIYNCGEYKQRKKGSSSRSLGKSI